MKHVLFSCGSLLAWLCWTEWASAQTVAAGTDPERKGSRDLSVSYQSYYNRINGVARDYIQGGSLSYRQFFPKHGLLRLQVEPLASRGNFVVGENYAHWTGLPWKGRHWDFAGGDFRTDTALVAVPFTNLTHPELSLRGAMATARTDRWKYSFYGGVETLSQGNRVPYRVRVPQSALGLQAAGNFPERAEIGFRFLRLTSSPEQIAAQSTFFPLNRQFTESTNLTSQASLRLPARAHASARVDMSVAKISICHPEERGN